MSVDKNLALVAKNGDILYPYKKRELSSGRYGFAISEPGKSDRKASPNDKEGQAVYTVDIEEVIKNVVRFGWGMRAKTDAGLHREREGTFRLGKGECEAYYVAPEYRHLVAGAPVASLDTLPIRTTASSRPSNEEENLETDRLANFSSIEFADALLFIDSEMTPVQREMLVLHAKSPDNTTTLEVLGRLLGDIDVVIAGNTYAALAELVSGYLNVRGLANPLQVIATAENEHSQPAQTQWQLRPQILHALRVSGYWAENPSAPDTTDEPPTKGESSQDTDELPTTRQSLIEARIGQGAFRKKMLYWWDGRCAVTGCKVTEAVIASHAVPWSTSTNVERLDHFNGLPLIATLDRLFDIGFISFTQSGKMVIHADLSQQDRLALGVNDGLKLRKTLHERHEPYLRRHREAHKFPI